MNKKPFWKIDISLTGPSPCRPAVKPHTGERVYRQGK